MCDNLSQESVQFSWFLAGVASGFSQDLQSFANLLKPELLAVGVPRAATWAYHGRNKEPMASV